MADDPAVTDEPLLAGLASASVTGVVATGARRGARVRRLVGPGPPGEAMVLGRRCAQLGSKRQAGRVVGAPGRVQHAEAELADQQGVAVFHPQIDEGGRAVPVHHDGQIQLPPELAGGAKVVRVGVGVDQVARAQPLLGEQRQIPVDLVELGIDDDGGPGLLAPHDVRETAAAAHLLEDHRAESITALRRDHRAQAGGATSIGVGNREETPSSVCTSR